MVLIIYLFSGIFIYYIYFGKFFNYRKCGKDRNDEENKFLYMIFFKFFYY